MTHLLTNLFASIFFCVTPAYPQVSQYAPGAGGVSIYQPLQYPSSSSSTSVAPPPPAAEPPGFLSQYTQPIHSQPSSPVYPGQPPVSQCLSSSPPSHAPFFPTSSTALSSSYSAPPSSGASFQHGGPGSPVSYMPPPPPQCGVSGTQRGSEPGPIPAPLESGSACLSDQPPPAPHKLKPFHFQPLLVELELIAGTSSSISVGHCRVSLTALAKSCSNDNKQSDNKKKTMDVH